MDLLSSLRSSDDSYGVMRIRQAAMALAVAIVRRAVHDLTITVEPGYKLPDLRREAYDFLMVRLWEPDNLWGQIISDSLTPSVVRALVNKLVKVETNGCITPIVKL